MCGRLNIIDDPLARTVSEWLGISFSVVSNQDLRPSESVSTINHSGSCYQQLELDWGIKPDWSKRMIINAQAETVATKPTFREAFEWHRVVVPCSGWYEWRVEQGNKRKYQFSNGDGSPLYMAGIALEAEQKLVTLTIASNSQCLPYHHRMPFLVPSTAIEAWLTVPTSQCVQFLSNYWEDELLIEHCE